MPTRAERKLWALQEAVIKAGEACGLDAIGRIMMYEQTAAWVQQGNTESLEGALEELQSCQADGGITKGKRSKLKQPKMFKN